MSATEKKGGTSWVWRRGTDEKELKSSLRRLACDGRKRPSYPNTSSEKRKRGRTPSKTRNAPSLAMKGARREKRNLPFEREKVPLQTRREFGPYLEVEGKKKRHEIPISRTRKGNSSPAWR